MPEFLFRRKKQQGGGGAVARRRTLNDAEETAEHVRTAREQLKQQQTEDSKQPQNSKQQQDSKQQDDGEQVEITRQELESEEDDDQPQKTATDDTRKDNNKQQQTSQQQTTQQQQEEEEVDMQQDDKQHQRKWRAVPLISKRSSFIMEREKFFELLKSKYPEQASNFELEHVFSNGGEAPLEPLTNGHASSSNGDPTSEDLLPPSGNGGSDSQLPPSPTAAATTDHRATNRYNECLFLRYGKHIRRCPMPSPLTLSTLKNLFINMFDLSPTLFEDHTPCRILIQDEASEDWRSLEQPSDITDHCRLLLVDTPTDHAPSPESDINMPFNFDASTLDSQSTQRSQSSTPGSYQGSPNEDNQATPRTELDTIMSNNGLWRSKVGLRGGDLSLLPDTLPLHQPHSLTPVTLSQASQTPSPPLPPPPPPQETKPTLPKPTSFETKPNTYSVLQKRKLLKKAQVLQHSAQVLKLEVKKMRADHVEKMSDYSRSFKLSSDRILSAMDAFSKTGGGVTGSDSLTEFRRGRMALYTDKEAYVRSANCSLSELKLLEQAVDCMRMDVVDRRCKVEEDELSALAEASRESALAVQQLEGQFWPLREAMKGAMGRELQVIVEEERFLETEAPRVQEASETCQKVSQTLDTMKQYAAVQSHRTPLIPLFLPVPNPDRHALMDNISAITPNHTHRVESLELAENVLLKRRALHSPVKSKLMQFESALRVQSDHLRPTKFLSDLEKRRTMKLKAMFLEDKFHREKQLEQELELERKNAEKKRNEEKRRLEEKWKKNESERRAQVVALRKQTQSNSFANRNGIYQQTPIHSRAHTDNAPLLNPFENEPAETGFTSNAPAPAITGRTTMLPQQMKAEHLDFSAQKRKSIGYIGELAALDPHYDTLIPASKVKPTSKSIARISPAADLSPQSDLISPGTRRKQEVANLQQFQQDMDRSRGRMPPEAQANRRVNSARTVNGEDARYNGAVELSQTDSEPFHTRGRSLGARDMPQKPTKYHEKQLRSISNDSLYEGSHLLPDNDSSAKLRQKSPQHSKSEVGDNRRMAATVFDSETLRVQPHKPRERNTTKHHTSQQLTTSSHNHPLPRGSGISQATANRGHSAIDQAANNRGHPTSQAPSRGASLQTTRQPPKSGHTSQAPNRGSGHSSQAPNRGSGQGSQAPNRGSGHASQAPNRGSGHTSQAPNRGSGYTSQAPNRGSGHTSQAPNTDNSAPQPRYHHVYTYHVPAPIENDKHGGSKNSQAVTTTSSKLLAPAVSLASGGGGEVKGHPHGNRPGAKKDKRRSGYSDVSATFHSGAHSDVSDSRSSVSDPNHSSGESSGTGNLRNQFLQNEPQHHDRINPIPFHRDSIPMRVTKSAQTPLHSDVPITSYPRSYTHHQAQKRTASNGRVSYQQVHLPGSMTGNHGNPPSRQRSGAQQQHHQPNQSFASRHNAAEGSLV